jgi:hypothetical protein
MTMRHNLNELFMPFTFLPFFAWMFAGRIRAANQGENVTKWNLQRTL